MKQNLITTIALLLMAVSGAWASPGSYSHLVQEIGSGGNIVLETYDYYYYDDGSTITISQNNSVIDGNGAVIDMEGSNISVFRITANNVTIKNLTIINCAGTDGPIKFEKNGHLENVICNPCGNGVTWACSKDKDDFITLTISYTGSGTGVMENYNDSGTDNRPWKDSPINYVVIGDGVKHIGDNTFKGYTGVWSVTVYDLSCTLGNNVFDGYSGNIYVFSDLVGTYQGATNWSDYADKIMAIPNPIGYCGITNEEYKVSWELERTSTTGVLNINGWGEMANYASADEQPWKDYRSVITSVIIEDAVKSIGDYAFGDCTGLTSITIPASVTSIGDNAFDGCTYLTSITLNGGAYIGNDAFPTTGNTTVTIANGLILQDNSSGEILSGDVTDMSKLNDHNLYVAIPYIDEKGKTAYCTGFTVLDNPMTMLSAGWYVAQGTVNYTGGITLDGDVNLILADNAVVNIGTNNQRISNYNCIIGYNNSLTIYGQSAQTGELKAYNSSDDQYAVYVKSYTQYGGNVTINDNKSHALYCYSGDLTLARGTLNVKATAASKDAIYLDNGHTANVSGGTLYADGNTYAIMGDLSMTGGNVGIYGTITGNATLGWTNASDFIHATTYGGTVTFSDGKSFHNGSEELTGSVSDKTKLNGKTLIGVPSTFALKANQNGNDYWTTFYFGGVSYKIDEGENATAYTATNNGSTLTLTPIGKEIPKNTAVIIKGTDNSISLTRDDNITVFSGSNELKGMDYETSQASGKTYYVLSKVNGNFGFFKLASNKKLSAHKAYLTVSSNAPEYFGFDEDANGIISIENGKWKIENESDAWFTIDGRKLNSVPTTKGVFINNGRKVVIK